MIKAITLITFPFSTLLFPALLLLNPLKHHVITVIPIIQRPVHTAYGCSGSARGLGNVEIRFLFPKHLCDLVPLGQRQQFCNVRIASKR